MNNDVIINSAIEKTITILAEHNLKYRDNDFEDSKNNITVTDDSVIVELSCLYGEKRGKKLKSARKTLKEYKNISCADEYIIFYYKIEELKNGKATVDKILRNSNNALLEITREEQNGNVKKDEYNIIDISAADMGIIKKMAEKYNISLRNLAQVIIQKDAGSRGKVQIRFTEEEAEIINAKAKEKDMSWSKFCRYSCGVVLKEYENMKDINLWNIQRIYGEGNRKKRLNVLFSDDEEYKRIKNFGIRVSLPISTFIRYCMLRDE